MPVNLKKFSHRTQRSLHMLNIFMRLLPSIRKLQKGVPLKTTVWRCPHGKQSSIHQRELLAVMCPVEEKRFCQQGVGWQILFRESENKYGLRDSCTDSFLKAFVQQLLASANAYRPLVRYFGCSTIENMRYYIKHCAEGARLPGPFLLLIICCSGAANQCPKAGHFVYFGTLKILAGRYP